MDTDGVTYSSNKIKRKGDVKLEDAYIQVTRDCNHMCVFCTQPKENVYLPKEEAKRMIKDFYDQGFRSVIYTGGEPTLHKDLLELMRFTSNLGFGQRMITNGSRLTKELCEELKKIGLINIFISIHTHKPEVAKKLTGVDDLNIVLKGLRNAINAGLYITINTTITSLNYPHLSEFYKFMLENFPEVSHYVLNFVEVGGRAAVNTWVVPRYIDIELELCKSLKLLRSHGKTFRVERVPLCYMCDFEEFSSETRRILGQQNYYTYFVAENELEAFGRGASYDVDYTKADVCKYCPMSKICAGVKKTYANLHGLKELYPLFKDPQVLIDKKLED